MIGNTHRVRARFSILPLLFIAATTALLAVRVAGAGTDPLEWARAGMGALSLCVLLALRNGGFARAAIYAVAIECAGGVAAFVFVDAPAIQAHVPAIVRAVADARQ